MDVKSELARIVRGRHEGWWALIGTAIGDEEACRWSMAGLSREALVANFQGPADSPTIVDHRVQALAAHDQQQLVRLSRNWKGVAEISLDLMNLESDFWTTAWCSSLRFLKNQGEVVAVPEATLPRLLALEFGVLFGREAPGSISSWNEARDTVLAAGTDYGKIRQLDASEVQFDDQIGSAELLELLGPDQSGQYQLGRLRFFFGRGHLIGEDGRKFLRRLVDELWSSFHEPNTSSSGVAVLVDLVLELEGLARSPHGLGERLMSSLAKLERPEPLLPVVNMLVGKGWRHP